jgi:hypothetical protein
LRRPSVQFDLQCRKFNQDTFSNQIQLNSTIIQKF